MNPITIAIADDHTIVRQCLRDMLSEEEDFEVVGEAGNGEDAFDIATRVEPDVLILDLRMPGVDGMSAIEAIAASESKTRILVLSMSSSEPEVIRALRAGAMGFVRKEDAMECLVNGVREVAAGRRYLGPALAERALEAYSRQSSVAPEGARSGLTGQEWKVLEMAAEGLTNQQVAERLGISRRTVETHRARGMSKLGIRNQTDLVLFFVREGVIQVAR